MEVAQYWRNYPKKCRPIPHRDTLFVVDPESAHIPSTRVYTTADEAGVPELPNASAYKQLPNSHYCSWKVSTKGGTGDEEPVNVDNTPKDDSDDEPEYYFED